MAEKKKKTFVMPATHAECSDLLYTTREDRLKIQKQADALEDLEKALKLHFINTLSKDSAGVAGVVALTMIKPTDVPVVKDWPKFYGHIQDTGQFDLLNKALNTVAVQERWDAGEEVPGVEAFPTKKVSCTKI